MSREKVNAMVHSKGKIEEVTILEEKAMDNITVKTKEGIVCKAIYNPFSNLIYADDLYAVIERR